MILELLNVVLIGIGSVILYFLYDSRKILKEILEKIEKPPKGKEEIKEIPVTQPIGEGEVIEPFSEAHIGGESISTRRGEEKRKRPPIEPLDK